MSLRTHSKEKFFHQAKGYMRKAVLSTRDFSVQEKKMSGKMRISLLKLLSAYVHHLIQTPGFRRI